MYIGRLAHVGCVLQIIMSHVLSVLCTTTNYITVLFVNEGARPDLLGNTSVN